MKLIHHQGFNCYHDCIISIVDHLGVDYPLSFARLWSEVDFRYDTFQKVFVTKRMITDLDQLGARVEILPCTTTAQTAARFTSFDKNEFIIVGMDAFYIPWNQFYQTFHGAHYFIVQNTKTDILSCFDPTYQKANQKISFEELIQHVDDIDRIHSTKKQAIQAEYVDEVKAVLQTLPTIRSELLKQMDSCKNADQESVLLLAKYIDTMISNRYLFRYYLQQQLPLAERNNSFLKSDFLIRWFIVKNGLYKASISKNKELLIDEVKSYFEALIEEEMTIAETML